MGSAQWMKVLLHCLFVFPLILHLAQGADTCSAIQQAYPDIAVHFPGYSEYNITAGEYWSLGCSALRPSCVILPRSAQQMSNAVKILRQNNEPFAVKSGGHSPNCFASIKGGPLLATRYLNEVTYNPTTRTVRVGPGNHWHNVTAALQGTGMNVVGGRMGEVGVGGYMLGGK
jgi:FAD/FMN-containing dehydrogenase